MLATQRIGLSEKEIAEITGVTRQAVAKKLQNKNVNFIAVADNHNGRPIKLYSRDVLELWGKRDYSLVKKDGKVKGYIHSKHGRDEHTATEISKVVFKMYLAHAEANVRVCCKMAITKIIHDIENGVCGLNKETVLRIAENEWLYKQWIMRSDATRKGIYYTEFWEAKWRKHNKKWSEALSKGTMRYDMWRIMENDFGAKRGYGAYRFIGLDDRKSDVWSKGADGSYFMPCGIYAWDLLTGELLHVEFDDTISADTYIKCILNVVFKYGCDCPLFSMENAKAAIAHRVKGVIRSLYTDADMRLLQERQYRLLLKDDVVSRNVPHIPKGIFKGLTERNFQEIKSGEALLFPRSFQGGNKHEQIELKRNNMPVHGKHTPDFYTYATAILEYAKNDLLDKERDSLKNWAEIHGERNTRRAMAEYYKPATIKKPNPEQIAYLLYYTCKYKVKRKMRYLGTIDFMYNGLSHSISNFQLFDDNLSGKTLQVIPMPNRQRSSGRITQWLVFDEHKGDDEFPRFICAAELCSAETIEEGNAMRVKMRAWREGYENKDLENVDYSYSENRVENIKTIEAANIGQLEENVTNHFPESGKMENDIIEVDGTEQDVQKKVMNVSEFLADKKRQLKTQFLGVIMANIKKTALNKKEISAEIEHSVTGVWNQIRSVLPERVRRLYNKKTQYQNDLRGTITECSDALQQAINALKETKEYKNVEALKMALRGYKSEEKILTLEIQTTLKDALFDIEGETLQEKAKQLTGKQL